jgi:restriction system protein
MSRSSFGASMRMIARGLARAERARQQALAREQANRLRAVRNAERQAKADAKEAARLHIADQVDESEELTRSIQEREARIDDLLARALAKNPTIDLAATLKSFVPTRFNEGQWPSSAPNRDHFSPEPPGFFARLIPGVRRRYERRVLDAARRFDEADTTYRKRLQARAVALEAFEAEEATRKAEVESHNASVMELQRGLNDAEYSAVVNYYGLVISRSLEGEPDAVSADVGYSPDSRHLVVELELPDPPVVPEETSFRYNRAADRVEPIVRPMAKRKVLYTHLISQIALKCIDTVYRGGPIGAVACLTLNGMLDTVDPATGQKVRPCLLSVRITADTFASLNLAQVQPERCLLSLKASVSRAPTELLPVKPLLELNMVDPRFIDSPEVLSGLDTRPNLMELSPNEFEGLITNLFAAMGLDTRQTRPSRDGGVDCVAFDPRPIFGGKVVIQAKRYKNTVGVSAVRDLYGTVQNEGASKGILVTTSGYGKASYDFANGKPLELLDGGNLLHLLAENAKVDARIVMPDGWVDLSNSGE